MATVSTNQMGTSWHRWFRRTNVYVAEYILMLILMGSFLGVLVSLWYSFFALLATSDYSAVAMAKETAMQLGTMVIVGLAAYWLYARVTGQDMIEQANYNRRSRTVFLTLWTLGVGLTLVGIAAHVLSALATTVFGFDGSPDAKTLWLKDVVPGVLAIATLGFGLTMVVKHVSRIFVLKTAALVVAATAVVLLVANIIMISVRKDIAAPKVDQSCTFSRYLSGKCSYDDYKRATTQTDTTTQDNTDLHGLFNNPSLYN